MKALDTFTSCSRRIWLVLGSLLLGALLLVITMAGLATATSPPDPAAQLHDAWKQAQKAGSYAFTADIEQTLIPKPTIYNVGRSDEHVALRAEGQVRLPDYSYLRLLPVLAPPGAELTPIEVERIGAETWVTMDGKRQRMDDPAGIAAPTGDYLAYLEAAREVGELTVVEAGGVRYDRLAFILDGPAFAEHVRRRLEEQVAADLPQGARLQPPASLKTLSGQGELWIGPDGLPRRQILELTLPDASEDYATEARIVTDFSDFGLREAAARTKPRSASGVASNGTSLRSVPDYEPGFLKRLIFLVALVSLAMLLTYRQRPGVYASVAILVIIAMLIQPFIPGWKLARFKARYGPSIAEAAPPTDEPLPDEPSPQEPSSLQDLLKGLDLAATPGAAPPGSPEAARLDAQAATWRDQLGITAYYEELALKYDGQDYDRDGLSDAYEMVLGTFTDTVDSDFDLITDTLEVEGFDYNGKHWATSPLDPDTNRDSLKDNLEWAYPIGQAGGPNPLTRPLDQRFDTDLDGVPDLWDDDNDGDGVPDEVDVSPFRALSGAGQTEFGTTSLPLTVNPSGHQGPIYVDLELRPTNADHLRYTLKTLDWPDDDRGQMRDLDQSTDDLTLIPMLRMESNVAPMQATQYGIALQHDPDTGKDTLYVPLTLVDAGGYPAAFHSRAAFSGADVPPGGAIELQVELVWVIQARVDTQVCDEDDKTNCRIETAQTPLHVYTDQFAVTGAHVSKEAGMETAVFATPDRDDEGDLAALFFGLEKSFLETPPWRASETGENRRPDRLDEVVERFRNPTSYPITQTFFIPTPVVSICDDFEHADEAVASLTMTMTNELLDTHFAQADTAFLLHATEHQGGELGLEDFSQQYSGLVVNLGDAPIMVIRALQISQYQYDAGGWKLMSVKEVLQSVEQRFGPFVVETDEIPEGQISSSQFQATKLFWLVASQGIQAAVKIDSHDLEYPDDPTGMVFKALKIAGPATLDKLPKLLGKYLTAETRAGWGWWDTLKWAKSNMRVTQMVLMAAIFILTVLIATKAISDEIKFLVEVTKAANVAKETVSVYRAIKWAGTSQGSWTRLEWGLKNAKMWAGIIVLVIQIALIWYMFYEITSQPGITNMQWWLALQMAIGATILAIIFFVLGLTVVGLIIVFIIQLIFWIASWFGYDLESKVAEFLGNLVLEVKLLATMPDEDSVFFDDANAKLADAQAGFTKGNRFILAGAFRGYVVATEDGSADDVARSKVWADAHVAAPVTVTVGLWRGSETCQEDGDPERRVCTNPLEGHYTLPDPTINLPLKFGLDMGYSFAFRHCWRSPLNYWGIFCETEQTEGQAESKEEDLSDMYVDVFPETLDGLWEWPSLHNYDKDADGVPDTQEDDYACDQVQGKSKTSWRCADSDGDGLLDSYEIQQRYKLGVDPVRADADGDTLTDAEELKWNIRPDWADTDADGLSDEKDLVRVVHPSGGTPELQGGWEMDFGGHFDPAQAWPLPNNADPDSDGLTDNQEYALNTNPRAFVSGLTVIVSPQPTPDTVLAAGSPMSVTVSALNFSPATIAPDVIICMGDLVTIDYLDLFQHLTSVHDVHYRIYERNPQCPDGTLGRRLTIYSGVDPGEWVTFVVAANVISPTATTVLTTTGIVEYTWEGDPRTMADRFVYKVDGDAPESTILYPAEGDFLTGGHVVVAGEARDPTSQMGKVELDVNHDQQWRLASGRESWAYTWELPPDGPYTLRSQASDVFPDVPGHRETPGPEVHVVVDQTPPQSAIQSPADGSQTTVPIGANGYRTLAVTGQSQDNLSGVAQVRVSPVRPRQDAVLDNPGGDATAWQTTLRLPTGRPNGRFDLAATARDGAGNVETGQTAVHVTVDNTPPQVTLIEAPGIAVTGTNPIALQLTADELAPFGALPQPKPLQGALNASGDATVWLKPATGDGALTLNTWGDFNGDDLDDLAISNVQASTVHVLFGRPGGWPPELNLAAADVTAGPFSGEIMDLDAGDLNGDGYDELVVGSEKGVRVFLGHDRGWPGRLAPNAAEAVLFADQATRAALAGDVNGDGMDDLLVATSGTAYLALGDAGLSLQPASLTMPAQAPSWQVQASAPEGTGWGGRIAAWDGRIWATEGSQSVGFFVYDPQRNAWEETTNLPPGKYVTLGGTLAAGGDGYIYATLGGWLGFYRYSVSTDTWDRRANTLIVPGEGAALAADGAGHLYLLAGNGQQGFCRYDIAINSWTSLHEIPQPVQRGGALTWAAGALYAFPGKDSNALYRYDPVENTWTRLANAPGSIGSGGSLAWNRGRYIYALRGQAKSHSYRYDLQTNTWEALPTVPEVVHEGGALAWLDGYLYAARGDRKPDFWRIYAPSIANVRLAGLGDINGDGLDDFAVADLDSGTVFLFQGRQDRTLAASTHVSVAHSVPDPALRTGAAVAGVGDVDGDGLDDFLVGEPGYNNDAGRVFLFKGRQPWPYTLFTSDADATLTGGSGDRAGSAVGPAGDVNSDSLDDFLVAGEGSRAWLLHGRTGGWPPLSGADATWTNGSSSPALSPCSGDANCDASPDLLIPAVGGRAGLFFGSVGSSCAVADTGVAQVEVGLGQVHDPTQPLTATLPVTWQQATASGGTWQANVVEPTEGLLRTYARGTDNVGNEASDPVAWTAGRWRTLPDVPQAVGDGGRMVVVGDRVYVTIGEGRRGFFSFPVRAAWQGPSAGGWQALAETPTDVRLGEGLAPAEDGGIYLLASDQLWRYNIATDTWQSVASSPSAIGTAAALASDGLGTLYALNSQQSKAFHRYAPARGWERLADAPAPAGREGIALAVHRTSNGVTIYALRGGYTSGFWRYDPARDVWDVLVGLPSIVGWGGALAWACIGSGECDSGDYLYAFAGNASGHFYRYHIPTGRWETMPNAPETIWEGGSLAWGQGGLFALRGQHWDGQSRYHSRHFWRWDDLLLVDRTPSQITWEPTATEVTAPSLVLTACVTDTLAGVQSVAFDVNGAPLPATYHPGSEIWSAAISAVEMGWQELARTPSYLTKGSRIAGWDGRIWAMALLRYPKNLFVYDPQSDTWQQKTDFPGATGWGAGLTAGGDGYLYATPGGNESFYRYDPLNDEWLWRANVPTAPYGGAALAGDGVGSLYLIVGVDMTTRQDRKDFYRFDIASNYWEKKADIPQAVTWGGAMTWATDAVYAFPGYGSAAFYRYSPATDTWTRLADAPDNIWDGGLAWDGARFIYALRGSRSTSALYRYDLHTDAWESLAATPGGFDEGGFAWLNGALYATAGYDSDAFWRYIPASKTVRPQAVDWLGNVDYGQERTIAVSVPDLGNIVENYADGDISTESLPPIEGTAVASQGIAQICVRTATTGSCIAPDGNPHRFHWAYARDFVVLSRWEDGAHNATASVRDTDGAEYVTDPVRIIVDATSPVASFTGPTGGSVITTTGRITVTGTATDATSGVTAVRFSPDNTASWREASQDGGTWSATWDVPRLDGQTWHLAVEATDRGGLTTQQRIALTVDNVLPGGLTPVTFNLEEGTHTGVGASLQATWNAATDGSGIAGTFVALDQITNTVPTAPAAGTSFSGSFDSPGDWYFHLRAADNASNWLIRHYGPWHVSDAGLGLSGGTSIVVVDGVVDIPHGEWLPEFHLLDEDVRTAGQTAQLYTQWDADDLFLGWQGGIWSLDGEAWFLFDTGAGGATDVAGHTLPFHAEYAFTVDEHDVASFLAWNGSTWVAVEDASVEYAHSSLGGTEVRIPLAALGQPVGLGFMAFAVPEDGGAAWAVFPATNPLAGPWTDAYTWPELGPQVMPSAGQPVADHTWLVVSSLQPPAVHLGQGSVITYEVRLGSSGLQAAEDARLTLEASPGLAYFSAEGDGACESCGPGSAIWAWQFGDLPSGEWRSLTVEAQVVDALTAGGAVTTTATLHTTWPDASPSDNLVTLSHAVDAEGLRVELTDPSGEDAVRPGWVTVLGTVPPGQGASAARVEVAVTVSEAPASADWQTAHGTLFWTGKVDVPEGVETVWVWARAWDVLGNVGPVAGTEMLVDAVGPQAAIEQPAVSPTLVGGRALEIAGRAFDSFPANGALNAVEIQLDGGPWGVVDQPVRQADGTYTWTWRWWLPAGEEGITYTLRVRAIDAAGNVGEPSVPVEVIVDAVAPTTTIAHPADGTWLEPDVTQVLVWGWSEDGVGVDRVEVSLDGGLTWRNAVLADGAEKLLAERSQSPTPQPETQNPKPETATLWAFAGTLPEDQVEYFIRARSGDRAGNAELTGPTVVVHMVVSRFWLPLVLKS